MQGTAGQGQGSGAQKAVALRRMRRRRACSRRHLASGAPDVYGDVTRAARGRMGSYGHSSWTLANHQDAHGTFSNYDTTSYVDCFVTRLVPSSACQADSVRDGHIARLSQPACCSPPRQPASCTGQKSTSHIPLDTQWHLSILRTTIAAAYDCIDTTLFEPFEATRQSLGCCEHHGATVR